MSMEIDVFQEYLHKFQTPLSLKPLEIQMYNPELQELQISIIKLHRNTQCRILDYVSRLALSSPLNRVSWLVDCIAAMYHSKRHEANSLRCSGVNCRWVSGSLGLWWLDC